MICVQSSASLEGTRVGGIRLQGEKEGVGRCKREAQGGGGRDVKGLHRDVGVV